MEFNYNLLGLLNCNSFNPHALLQFLDPASHLLPLILSLLKSVKQVLLNKLQFLPLLPFLVDLPLSNVHLLRQIFIVLMRLDIHSLKI
jgi:hypothetical protein